VATLLLAIVVFVSIQSIHTKDTTPESLFRDWSQAWNKTYATEAERSFRFSVFTKNLQRIDAMNHKGQKAKYGLTRFSDLTRDEFRKYHSLSHLKRSARRPVVSGIPSQGIDWVKLGKATPVKDQGECGSGFLYALVETVESANMVAGRPMTEGSVEEIADCGNSNGTNFGCNGGDPASAWSWVLTQGGLESASCYPPNSNGQCEASQCPNPDPNLILSGVAQIPSQESQMYQALTKSTLFVCVDASTWDMYQGGIIAASSCGSNIDHCVQVTGYSPDQGGYWILRNSWGTAWGLNGFVYLQYGQNTCGITAFPIFAKP